jgi:hypothetical protein
MVILVRHYYAVTLLVIIDVVVMKLDTRFTCLMERVDSNIGPPNTNFKLACVRAIGNFG